MENVILDKFDINEYFKKLRILLCKLGYENKIINISVAVYLHQTYGKGFSEETFAQEALGVTARQYKKAKAVNGNITILKIKDIISDEEIRKLRNQLIDCSYAMNKINYKQFKKLYSNYGKGLTERTFAIKVLELSYANYKRLREDENYYVIILKNVGDIEEIKNKMLEDGYRDYYLESYSDFLELYYKYGSTFTEVYFSINVLNITYDNYIRLKKNDFKSRILSTIITQDDIDKIIEILEGKGYKNKAIDYTEFLQLYQEYGTNMTEKEFALQVLKLTSDMYKYMKLKGGKTSILREQIPNRNIEAIKQKLINQKLINKSIDYTELKELHLKYGMDMSEKEFALDILELSLDGYRALRRCNNSAKFRILKKEIPKELSRVKDILISKGYRNKKIYYDELHSLYLTYGHFIGERQFAMQALELSSSSYQDIKYKSKKNEKLRATILPYKKVTIEYLEKIKQELIEAGFENKKLSINEIDELYQKYGEGMTRVRFYEDVLCIYNVAYITKSSHITILPKKDILDDTLIEQIKQILNIEGYYYQKVRPEDTYKLYEKYGTCLTYNTFIYKVLGITRKQVSDAITHNGYVKIVDINIKNTMELIQNIHLKEIRYYSKEEILNICEKYNVNLKDFILYSLLKTAEHNLNTYIDTYLDILNDTNQLWIGNDRVSNDIISKYYYQITEKIHQIISSIKKMYPTAYKYSEDKSDDFQTLLMLFIENGSEIEKNFMVYDNPNWSRYFYGKLKKAMRIRAISRIASTKGEITPSRQDEAGIHPVELADKNFNTEELALSNINDDEISTINNCVLLFGKLLSNGNSINEAKKIVCDRFCLSESSLVNYIKKYLENHNRNFNLELLDINDEYNYQNTKIKK